MEVVPTSAYLGQICKTSTISNIEGNHRNCMDEFLILGKKFFYLTKVLKLCRLLYLSSFRNQAVVNLTMILKKSVSRRHVYCKPTKQIQKYDYEKTTHRTVHVHFSNEFERTIK